METQRLGAFALAGLCTAVLAGCAPAATSEAASLADPMTTIAALSDIADANNGNRATGTPGGTASGDYIVESLESLGLEPVIEEFPLRDSDATGRNIIVDLNAGTGDDVVLIGAHYDSVEMGPGIGDNATGVANLLAAAARNDIPESSAKTIRLAFWDAEEIGIQGSEAYLANLSEHDRPVSYFNFDMTAPENGTVTILDADQSSLAEFPDDIRAEFAASLPAVPAGAEAAEDLVRAALPEDVTPKEDASVQLATDTRPFFSAGIPSTGFSVLAEQLVDHGDGTSSLEYIPCYHRDCDNADHVDETTLRMSTDAVRKLLVAASA